MSALSFPTNGFATVVRILVRFDNTAMLQNGQEFLTVLVGKDFQGIVAWRDERGKSGLEVVIEVVAKLLDPNADESGSVFVGALITKLIVRSGDALTDVLPDLLRAVTLRLDTAKNATFIQTLVMVFAQLFVRGTYPMETIVSFLEGLRVGDRTGLEMLVNVMTLDQMPSVKEMLKFPQDQLEIERKSCQKI
jgi:hypothetical protein